MGEGFLVGLGGGVGRDLEGEVKKGFHFFSFQGCDESKNPRRAGCCRRWLLFNTISFSFHFFWRDIPRSDPTPAKGRRRRNYFLFPSHIPPFTTFNPSTKTKQNKTWRDGMGCAKRKISFIFFCLPVYYDHNRLYRDQIVLGVI